MMTRKPAERQRESILDANGRGGRGFLKVSTGTGRPPPRPRDPGTSALLELATGEGREPAHGCEPAQPRASGVLSGCPCHSLWPQTPKVPI